MEEIIREEINVRNVEFIASDSELVVKRAKPVFKALGPKFGKAAQAVAERIKTFSPQEIETLERTGILRVDIGGNEVAVSRAEVEIVHEDIQGLTIGVDQDLVIALDTKLTDDLVDEGLAREFVNRVQNLRKEKGFEVVDRIAILYRTPERRLHDAIQRCAPYIQTETLAVKLLAAEIPEEHAEHVNINEYPCVVYIATVSQE
ncbi:MAG: DUF5915 domain-containing protein, partial [Bacteroidota bacterium]|nr:DUF5915 domain-containing protein [Bacteroidota bacterium]